MQPTSPRTASAAHANACGGCLASADKRASLKSMIGAALALGAGIQGAHAAEGPRPGDLLVDANDAALRTLGPTDVTIDSKPLIVVPFDPGGKRARDGSRFNRILLLKLDPGTLASDTRSRAQAAGGVLAYSAICTHQACDVNAWRAKEKTLLCFCHLSQFQPADDAGVVAGPAPRALPSLALKVEGDKLVVAGAFSAPPGAG